MSTNEPKARVALRVGIVHHGVLIEERRFTAPRRITIGRGPRCDLTLFTEDAPVRQLLFERRGRRGVALCLDDATEGRIVQGGVVSEMELLRNTGAVEPRGRGYRLALGKGCRGRVALGEYTVLFQLIAAPAARRPRPALPAALRGGLRGGFDSAVGYLWIAALLLHGGLIGFWQLNDWPVRPRFDPDAVLAYVPLVRAEPVPKMIEDPEPEADDAAWEDADEWEELKENRARSVDRRKNRVDRAKREVARGSSSPLDAKRRAELLARMLDAAEGRMGVIGARGATAEVFRPGVPGVDMEALIGSLTIGGTGDARRGGSLRGPAGGKLGHEAATVETVRIGGGDVEVATRGAGRERALGRVKRERASSKSSPGYLDVAAVTGIVKRATGAIKGCYERALPRHPELSGRIAVRFTIAGSGRVVSTSLVANELNDQVGRCVTGVFERLRFPAPEGGAAIFEYPFFFTPAN